MVILKKTHSDDSVRGQLRNLIRQIGIETEEGLKETGKEIVRGATLKTSEQAPFSQDKTGEHTKINPQKAFQEADRAEIAKIQAALHRTQTQTPPSQKEESIQDKKWREKEQARQELTKKQVAQPVNLAATGSKRRAGDWRRGTKLKKGINPMEMHPEYSAARGKQ